MGDAKSHQLTRFVEGEVMTIVTIGIDLAKNVFAVHDVDAQECLCWCALGKSVSDTNYRRG